MDVISRFCCILFVTTYCFFITSTDSSSLNDLGYYNKLHADVEKVIFCLKGIYLLFCFGRITCFAPLFKATFLCSLYIDFYYLSLMGQLPWNCLVLYIVFTSFMLFTVTEQKFFILYMHCNLGIPKFCIVVTSPQTAMQLLHYFGMAAMCCVLLLTTLMATQLLINLICQV